MFFQDIVGVNSGKLFSKNSFYNNAFVYAATAHSGTILFLAPVARSTGYNGESGWYVKHQCLKYVPFTLG